MTRQRRTHLLFLALVPVVVFAAVRCADSSSSPPSALTAPVVATTPPPAASAATAATIARLHEQTDWIGRFHNDALQYVFTSISRLPGRARDKHGICETARRAYGEFHRSRRGAPVPASVDAQLEGFCSRAPAASIRSAALATPHGAPRTDVSATAQSLMDQIASAIDVSTSYADLNTRVSSIESDAASSLSYDEAASVFTVGSVALNSATYWANNLTDWVPFTNTAEYSKLLVTRVIPPGEVMAPVFNNGDDSGGFSWGGWATSVWNDTKAAAKRAAGGDVRAAAKAIMGAALVDAPIFYDIVLGAAAAGSIGAALML